MVYEKYKGLEIYSAKGLHSKVAKIFSRFEARKDSSILILGSGSGSFDKRLIDNEYNNITSCDINKERYKLVNTNFVKVDLNTEFNEEINSKYDFIIGLEIIEHLNSPFDFLRRCKRLLNKDGIMIVSTPNVHNCHSRILFLLRGYPGGFLNAKSGGGEGANGHISPILDSIFNYYLKQLNLKLIKKYCISIHISDLNTIREKVGYMILFLLSLVLYPFMIFNKKFLKGGVSIYIIKNRLADY